MPVQKPQVCSIQKKNALNHPLLVRQIFEARASRCWADRLSSATVAVAMPAYFWKETQSHGEFLTLMFIRYLMTSETWVIYSSLGQEQYWHELGSLLCPGDESEEMPLKPWRWVFKAGKHPPTPQQGDWDPNSFATPHYQLPRATLPSYLTAYLIPKVQMPDRMTHMILQGTRSATAAVTSAGLCCAASISWRSLSLQNGKNLCQSAGQGAAAQDHNSFGNGNIQTHSKPSCLQTHSKW